MNPLISVIIPVYNVEAYLTPCVESILAQTYTHWELILVDDGSSDASPALCDAFAASDRRIRVIHKENGGPSEARNVGLEAMTGEFFTFVDSDDWIAPEMLATLLAAMTEETDCVYSGACETDPEGNIFHRSVIEEPLFLDGPALIRGYFRDLYPGMTLASPCAKLFRSSLFTDLRFQTGLLYEDLQLTPYWCLKARKVRCLTYAGYHYRLRGGSIMRSVDPAHLERLFRAHLTVAADHIALFSSLGDEATALTRKQWLVGRILDLTRKNEIPRACLAEAKAAFLTHYRALLSSASSHKERLQYRVFRYGGPRLYRLCSRLYHR